WAGFNDPAVATLHWRKVRSLTAGLASSPEVAQLGLTAAVMIMFMGWRLGGSSDDGEQAFEDEAIHIYAEGRSLAESSGSGQEAMLANLVASYASVRGLTGHIDEFQLTLEAVDLADRTGDVGVRTAMRAATTYPRFCAGQLIDGLRIADEGIEFTGGDPGVGAGIAYACPYAVLRFVRGLLLGGLGRLNEGFVEFERTLQLGRDVDDLDGQGSPRCGPGGRGATGCRGGTPPQPGARPPHRRGPCPDSPGSGAARRGLAGCGPHPERARSGARADRAHQLPELPAPDPPPAG